MDNSLVITDSRANHQDFEQFLDSTGAVDLENLLRAFLPEETVQQIGDYIKGKGSLI